MMIIFTLICVTNSSLSAIRYKDLKYGNKYIQDLPREDLNLKVIPMKHQTFASDGFESVDVPYWILQELMPYRTWWFEHYHGEDILSWHTKLSLEVWMNKLLSSSFDFQIFVRAVPTVIYRCDSEYWGQAGTIGKLNFPHFDISKDNLTQHSLEWYFDLNKTPVTFVNLWIPLRWQQMQGKHFGFLGRDTWSQRFTFNSERLSSIVALENLKWKTIFHDPNMSWGKAYIFDSSEVLHSAYEIGKDHEEFDYRDRYSMEFRFFIFKSL